MQKKLHQQTIKSVDVISMYLLSINFLLRNKFPFKVHKYMLVIHILLMYADFYMPHIHFNTKVLDIFLWYICPLNGMLHLYLPPITVLLKNFLVHVQFLTVHIFAFRITTWSGSACKLREYMFPCLCIER